MLSLAYTEPRVLFGGNAHSLCKCLKEIAVVGKVAFFKGFIDACAFVSKCFRDADSSGGNILVYGSACRGFKDAAYIGFT